MVLTIRADDGTKLFTGSCRVFGLFRVEVSKVLGMEFYPQMAASIQNGDMNTIRLSYFEVLEYASEEDTRVATLLNADDTGGQWSPRECQEVYSFLEEIYDRLVADNEDWVRETADKMIQGARHCCQQGLTARFNQ